MELSDLRAFVRAAELGSFTRAAQALGTTQPSISRTIGRLESEWQGELFYRTGRGVVLSDLGHQAMARATALIRAFDQSTEDLRAASRMPAGEVGVALLPSIAAEVASRLVNHLQRYQPRIRPVIYEAYGDQIRAWLSDGTADIGIHSQYAETPPVGTACFLKTRLVLVGLRKGWTLAPEIPFRRLSEFDLVLPARSNGLRMIVDQVARREGVHLRVLADADSTVVQRSMARRSGCYMIKAPYAMKDEIGGGEFATAIVSEPYLYRHCVIETGRQRPLSRSAREVSTILLEILKEMSVADAAAF